ncbi:MAG: outer membrane beta-barrel protein [Balneolaceae bacterium]
MKKLISLLVFFMGAITFSASAQYSADRATDENTFGFGPRLGFYHAGDAEDGNFYGGVQARAKFGAVVGLEGSLEYRARQEYDFGDYTARSSSVPITASFMLFAPLSEYVSPYGLVGAGAYYTIYTYSDGADDLGFSDENSFEFGYHLGFGTELWFTDHTALSLDYRYMYLDPDPGDESFEDVNFDGNVFTASIMFYF